jgi:hypothetical protein
VNPALPAFPASAAGPVPTPAAPRAPERSFGAVLARLRGADAPLEARPAPRAELPGAPPAAAAPGPALRALAAVDRARARLDGVLTAARSGRTFTAQELLGLQAEAYRTVQIVDLSVKVAEQGAQSIRQALQTQV